MEWYRTDADYTELMKDLEQLFIYLFHSLQNNSHSRENGNLYNEWIPGQARDDNSLTYQGKMVNLAPPWERVSITEAFERWAHLDLTKLLEDQPMREEARKKGYQVMEKTTWEEAFNQIYLNEIEPNFPSDRPLILYDYPLALASISRKKQSDPRFAERFELYIGNLELANCFSELADWKEQELRFDMEQKERVRLGKIRYPSDTDFIDALKMGLPLCAGGALGVDRLVMLFANAKTIQETLFFPADEMWEESDK